MYVRNGQVLDVRIVQVADLCIDELGFVPFSQVVNVQAFEVQLVDVQVVHVQLDYVQVEDHPITIPDNDWNRHIAYVAKIWEYDACSDTPRSVINAQ